MNRWASQHPDEDYDTHVEAMLEEADQRRKERAESRGTEQDSLNAQIDLQQAIEAEEEQEVRASQLSGRMLAQQFGCSPRTIDRVRSLYVTPV